MKLRTVCRRCGSVRVVGGWATIPKRKGERTLYSMCPLCIGKPKQKKKPLEVPDDPFSTLHYDAHNK